MTLRKFKCKPLLLFLQHFRHSHSTFPSFPPKTSSIPYQNSLTDKSKLPSFPIKTAFIPDQNFLHSQSKLPHFLHSLLNTSSIPFQQFLPSNSKLPSFSLSWLAPRKRGWASNRKGYSQIESILVSFCPCNAHRLIPFRTVCRKHSNFLRWILGSARPPLPRYLKSQVSSEPTGC